MNSSKPSASSLAPKLILVSNVINVTWFYFVVSLFGPEYSLDSFLPRLHGYTTPSLHPELRVL